MFKIVIVGGPAEGYIQRNLKQLLNQFEQDWEACVILDPVGDKTYEQAKAFESDKIKVILNDERLYALPNIIKSINEMHPSDDDIIATVDADDWLTHEDSLGIVKRAYDAQDDLMLTYGSWVSYPNSYANTNTKEPYKEEDFKNIRKAPFRASHIRTFKYRVWKHIDQEDFKDDDGNMFRVAWDLSFMWPMLEMAGFHRTKYIPHKVYTYNQETPHNDAKLYLRQQMFYTDYQAARPSYSYKEDL
ncbi:MAG: glycosyltransferase [Candidatus Altiarchaeales archaeon]|nr:glycosyltransferase [Candidatus Altiarchaeales archaeon]